MSSNVVRLYSSQAEYTSQMKETVRPFRLWDSKARHWVRSRNYATDRAALDAALILVRWEKVGRTLEVLDVRTHRLLGVYERKVNSIAFSR